MKIGIDISQIVYETGISSYTRNLVSALLKIDKKNDYVLFGASLRRFNVLEHWNKSLGGKFTEKLFRIPPAALDFLWNRLHILPIEMFTGKLDVFHSSDWTQSPAKAFKVTTIHDLAPLRFPEISHPKIVAAHRRRLEWVKKEVDKIIAVSEFTKREIVDLLGIEPERIVVIPEAADPDVEPAPAKEIEKIKRKYMIDNNYLLVVGADPRKNVPLIVQAFSRIRSSMTGLNLVIVGRLWQELPYTPGVSLLGHVSKEDLNVLYSGAEALVYTSFYEGFGLPILEAMKVGTPVVTSNVSSMPEVAGDRAVLVNPKDPSEIAEGIKEVLKNRANWSKKGIARAKEFSWKKAAKETLEVYNARQ